MDYALSALPRDRKAIDLMLRDFVVPKVHGLYLVSMVHATGPELPVTVISSYLSEIAGRIILEGSADSASR